MDRKNYPQTLQNIKNQSAYALLGENIFKLAWVTASGCIKIMICTTDSFVDADGHYENLNLL